MAEPAWRALGVDQRSLATRIACQLVANVEPVAASWGLTLGLAQLTMRIQATQAKRAVQLVVFPNQRERRRLAAAHAALRSWT
jgi:hypothetical protein